jgi:two-component system LytT family response regulator
VPAHDAALDDTPRPARRRRGTEEPPMSLGRDEPVRPNRLLIRTGGRVFFVRVEDIDWIEAVGNYARIHVRGASHLIRRTMSDLEERLPAGQFARIHRATIVNLDRIREMQPAFHGDYLVLLTDGTNLRLSRRYRDRLLASTL